MAYTFQTFVQNLPWLPPKHERRKATNPFKLMTMLTPLQWCFFLAGWFAWIIDAIDFFAVSLASTRLATYFHKTAADVSLAITLTLLLRGVGALIFGLLSDRYGRKWPLIANLLLLAIVSLGTGFIKTFKQFLGVRALFGCLMGGPWGMAVSLALENMPVECRGLFSGLIQLGYPTGYLVIACINLNKHVAAVTGWRNLFYAGAAFSTFAAVFRLVLPESTWFAEQKRLQKASGVETTESRKNTLFLREVGRMARRHWVRCVYGILFMSAFNFYSHGSQDLYPTYLQKSKGLSAHQSTVITIISNVGSICGCFLGGWISQFLGRRLTMIAFALFMGCMIPLWLIPDTFSGLAAGGFFVQFGVQGAYGIVPVYLSEISPPAFRAMWPGVAYQVGNMVASASAQIEATAGERLKDPKTGLPEYGRVSAILIGAAAGVLILLCLFGLEQHSSHYEEEAPAFAVGPEKYFDDTHDGDHKHETVHMEEATPRAHRV
ncbi:hypothetical protein I302_101640 [Kwoniella bestiolae CBS 10118]|uniref:Major facilitator superfamily (MFS) profile domain-containing protein n=1 Tax=Kwoniella bestiolae CBS 10118 TaxID=1296100 RepID=A0A1B9GCT5_9TREE|nr:hypothetical protein I302_00320 [Kwoniella bestiolae CBS 10118]OCF28831.1 hypothetical protein I302_00320 [Kwoniella bestiolae CBS 10118]